jgi:c-di-GMP-binding flagellar brake protein YcgR
MTKEGKIEQIFSPGSKVVIEYSDHSGSVHSCATQVEDIEGMYLVLQTPVINNQALKFQESQELTLRRLDDEMKEAYVTNVFVIDIRQGKVPLLVCSKPKKINRTSLRRFSRFGVNLPLEYAVAELEGKGQLNDLSLTGCFAELELCPEIKEGAVLKLKVIIPGESGVYVFGKVIRVDQSDVNSRAGVAIDYIEVDENTRESLYNYIFQLQLTADSILGMPGRDD